MLFTASFCLSVGNIMHGYIALPPYASLRRAFLSDYHLWNGLSSVYVGLVLSAEAVNSAIEALADRVSPAYDEAIKRTKDLAAGAVLLLAIASAVVGLIIFLPKLTLLS